MQNASLVDRFEPGLFDGYGTGRARVVWFQWQSYCKPGKWDLSFFADGVKGMLMSVPAIVDDFGALVVVEG